MIFCNIYCIFAIYRNLVHFENKYQLHSLNISEVIDSKKYGYLNARKVPFQNTCGESTSSRVRNIAEKNTAAVST